jgi:hypothetical protein
LIGDFEKGGLKMIDIVRKKVCKKVQITGSQSGGVAASNTNIFVGQLAFVTNVL